MLDTIVALSTPQGNGAIAVIRLSGDKSFDVVSNFFEKGDRKLNIEVVESHSLHFGVIKEGDEIIDEVLVSFFKNPNSYTGEDIVEISSHGSIFIQKKILDLSIKYGATLAKEGEFTQRAFLNGKLDLSQAEAVADLIGSESKASHELAINQLRGGVSDEMAALREELINFTAMIELELDFGEEDVEFANRVELYDFVNNLQSKIEKLIQSFDYGNAIKEGVPVTILGKPNAGKSTLLNTLLNEDRAIVSDIAGTTRDTIEEVINIDGVKFRFIDTAGLRNTSDEIEEIGIMKAKEKASASKIVLYLYDRNDTTEEEIVNDIRSIVSDETKVVLIENKIDENGGFFENELNKNLKKKLFSDNINTLIGLSSIDKESVASLKSILVDMIQDGATDNQVVISNTRHLHELKEAQSHLILVKEGMDSGLSGDLLAFHLKDAIRNIGSITGEIDVDKDILGTIFGKFCIGK